MRVLFDTNIFISYLLKSDKDKTITTIIEAGFESKYKLLLPHNVINELNQKLTGKKYLSSRISKADAQELLEVLTKVADVIPEITELIPKVTRDKKDDFLLACAVVGEADYLVSGDKDLQVIKNVQGVKIVSPIEFSEILKELESAL